ncbi:hypothetical protein O9992_12095 [Vibrio lentus]|nr:hypothetical protein [Vibrio lentus]
MLDLYCQVNGAGQEHRFSANLLIRVEFVYRFLAIRFYICPTDTKCLMKRAALLHSSQNKRNGMRMST